MNNSIFRLVRLNIINSNSQQGWYTWSKNRHSNQKHEIMILNNIILLNYSLYERATVERRIE